MWSGLLDASGCVDALGSVNEALLRRPGRRPCVFPHPEGSLSPVAAGLPTISSTGTPHGGGVDGAAESGAGELRAGFPGLWGVGSSALLPVASFTCPLG